MASNSVDATGNQLARPASRPARPTRPPVRSVLDDTPVERPRKGSESDASNQAAVQVFVPPTVLPKSSWMEDRDGAVCMGCRQPFTVSRRRHHCRFCGRIFCAQCTLGRMLGNRSCNKCIQQYALFTHQALIYTVNNI